MDKIKWVKWKLWELNQVLNNFKNEEEYKQFVKEITDEYNKWKWDFEQYTESLKKDIDDFYKDKNTQRKINETKELMDKAESNTKDILVWAINVADKFFYNILEKDKKRKNKTTDIDDIKERINSEKEKYKKTEIKNEIQELEDLKKETSNKDILKDIDNKINERKKML